MVPPSTNDQQRFLLTRVLVLEQSALLLLFSFPLLMLEVTKPKRAGW